MIKKITISLFLAIGIVLSGCGGDNAFDGTNLQGSGEVEGQGDVLSSLQENVLMLHANALVDTIGLLKDKVNAFDKNITKNDVEIMQSSFINILHEFKGVESFYVALDFDNSMIQIKQMNAFNTAKGLDVAANVQRALDETRDIESALHKNSSKSMSGLEYLLYGYSESSEDLANKMNIDNKRRVDALKVVLLHLEGLAQPMATFYINDTKFRADTTDGFNAVVNALVDSAYKAKEWRLGEPSGIAIKYKDNPDPERLEFYHSAQSLEAIVAILNTHNDVMGVKQYENFGTFASDNGASSVVKDIRIRIDEALSISSKIDTLKSVIRVNSPIDVNVQRLYTLLDEIQELYFVSLIQALDLTAEIIEADGD